MAKKDKIDPVTYEILSHRLFQIINEARMALMRVSGSTVVTEGGGYGRK